MVVAAAEPASLLAYEADGDGPDQHLKHQTGSAEQFEGVGRLEVILVAICFSALIHVTQRKIWCQCYVHGASYGNYPEERAPLNTVKYLKALYSDRAALRESAE